MLRKFDNLVRSNVPTGLCLKSNFFYKIFKSLEMASHCHDSIFAFSPLLELTIFQGVVTAQWHIYKDKFHQIRQTIVDENRQKTLFTIIPQKYVWPKYA